MESLKSKYFLSHPDDPVIFHRKEMINARRPFEVLGNDKVRRNFDEELLELLASWEYTVITVCIDKKKHKETYLTWRFEPYHYCLALLLERFVFFLDQNGGKGDVMAESRGGKEDKKLKNSFEKLWENGTDYVDPTRFQKALTSKQCQGICAFYILRDLNIANKILSSWGVHLWKKVHLKKRGPFRAPIAFAIHLQITGLADDNSIYKALQRNFRT